MLDLCSGIAGISMVADWVGIETAAFCEIEEFNQKVLRKNYPNIPIFPDLYKLTKQSLIDGGVDVDAIGVISAGYPCQGESLVGKRRGAEDERWLWPEVFRIIRELRPTWFVGENVAGHRALRLGRRKLLDKDVRISGCQCRRATSKIPDIYYWPLQRQVKITSRFASCALQKQTGSTEKHYQDQSGNTFQNILGRRSTHSLWNG